MLILKKNYTEYKKLYKKKFYISLCELYDKLRVEKEYPIYSCSLFRIVKNLKYSINTEYYERYTPPTSIGIKWQMDVKIVPKQCCAGKLPDKFYQYTIIDEAPRERFIYPYKEHSSYSTINIVKESIICFGYKTEIIKIDNGQEFMHIKKTDKIYPLDNFLNSLNINNKLIKTRTPRHNGKVKRSHRNDQQRFYSYLRFYSYDDLLLQMKSYLKR